MGQKRATKVWTPKPVKGLQFESVDPVWLDLQLLDRLGLDKAVTLYQRYSSFNFSQYFFWQEVCRPIPCALI
jgi:hypothetical protein